MGKETLERGAKMKIFREVDYVGIFHFAASMILLLFGFNSPNHLITETSTLLWRIGSGVGGVFLVWELCLSLFGRRIRALSEMQPVFPYKLLFADKSLLIIWPGFLLQFTFLIAVYYDPTYLALARGVRPNQLAIGLIFPGLITIWVGCASARALKKEAHRSLPVVLTGAIIQTGFAGALCLCMLKFPDTKIELILFFHIMLVAGNTWVIMGLSDLGKAIHRLFEDESECGSGGSGGVERSAEMQTLGTSQPRRRLESAEVPEGGRTGEAGSVGLETLGTPTPAQEPTEQQKLALSTATTFRDAGLALGVPIALRITNPTTETSDAKFGFVLAMATASSLLGLLLIFVIMLIALFKPKQRANLVSSPSRSSFEEQIEQI